MKRTWIWISMMVLPMVSMPSYAGGIFFKKRNRPADPSLRVPELVFMLKSDRRASNRADAAEELRGFDPASHPAIVPALIESLQSDSSWSVRREAAKTLGRMRPVSPIAGRALQKTVKGDSNMLVRLQARSSLLGYYLAGYRTGAEEPTAKNPAKGIDPAQTANTQPVVPAPAKGPELTPAKQESNVVIIGPKPQTPQPKVARPLPKGQPWSTAVPTEPLREAPAPPVIVESGPSLTPPPVTPPKF